MPISAMRADCDFRERFRDCRSHPWAGTPTQRAIRRRWLAARAGYAMESQPPQDRTLMAAIRCQALRLFASDSLMWPSSWIRPMLNVAKSFALDERIFVVLPE